MKRMLFLCAMFIAFNADSQVLKKLGNKAKQKIDQRANQKVDKKMDEGLDELEGKGTKNSGSSEAEKENEKTSSANTPAASSSPSLETYSKYDFVPGEKIMAFENFERTEIGDFPTNWNTNITAEVVTLNNKEGKWLKLNKEGAWHPEFITNLPENFTLEFDLAVNPDWRGTHFAVNIANLDRPQDYVNYYHHVSWRGNYAVHLELKPAQSEKTSANSKLIAGASGNHTINNDVDFKNWDNASNNFVHVAMWRQGQRLRVYANGEKIWDVPRAFDASSKFNAVTYGMQGSYGPEDYMLLGNIRLAVGATDTRNKLITEGKFVTRGILFDINSDQIKPESAGALKNIAGVLKENAEVKIKIVGHTDSDGDDAKNMDLSKRRAVSVKNYLIEEFGISETNIQTDGKGESQPVDENKSAEGKANNRRVEFIKQ